MFDSFIKFLELGLYHILNVDSYDHILFVALISIPFLFKDWKTTFDFDFNFHTWPYPKFSTWYLWHN